MDKEFENRIKLRKDMIKEKEQLRQEKVQMC